MDEKKIVNRDRERTSIEKWNVPVRDPEDVGLGFTDNRRETELFGDAVPRNVGLEQDHFIVFSEKRADMVGYLLYISSNTAGIPRSHHSCVDNHSHNRHHLNPLTEKAKYVRFWLTVRTLEG